MALSSNLRAFRASTGGDALVNSYLMLVGFELVLKNAGYKAKGGHDIPEMLVDASKKNGVSPAIAGQLVSYSTKLKPLLNKLSCQGVDGKPRSVPSYSYPYIRYCRYAGDWNGIKESSSKDFQDLESFCKQLVSFLLSQKNALGLIL